MEVAVIAHASDIDGVGSAALVRRKLCAPLRNLFFTDYSGEGLEYARKGLDKIARKGVRLFIADLGLNKGIYKDFERIVDNVNRHGGEVCWYDHHVWSQEDVKSLASKCKVAIVGENSDYSGAEITRIELGYRNGFEKRFSDLVHYSDFNLIPKDGKRRRLIGHYMMAIAYYNTFSRDAMHARLRHIADMISRGRLIDGRIIKDANAFARLSAKRMKKMAGELYIRRNVAVGFSTNLQSTWACANIHEKASRDVSIYINTGNMHGHMRSIKADCSVVANKLGGGGHPHAAGFSLRPNSYNGFRTKEDKERFANNMQKMFS